MATTSRYTGKVELRSAKGERLGEAEARLWVNEDASGRTTWGGSFQPRDPSLSFGIGETVQLLSPGRSTQHGTASVTWRTVGSGEPVGVYGKGTVPF